VLTGTLPTLTRDAASEMIRVRGGKAAKNLALSARALSELDEQFLTF
jgi:BRCT domain type II-containing protein